MMRCLVLCVLPGAYAVTGGAHAEEHEDAFGELGSAQRVNALAAAHLELRTMQAVMQLAAARHGDKDALARAPQMILDSYRRHPTQLAVQQAEEQIGAGLAPEEPEEEPEEDDGLSAFDVPLHLTAGTRAALVELAENGTCLFCPEGMSAPLQQEEKREEAEFGQLIAAHADEQEEWRHELSSLLQERVGARAAQATTASVGDTVRGKTDHGNGGLQIEGYNWGNKEPTEEEKRKQREKSLKEQIYGKSEGEVPQDDAAWDKHDRSQLFHRRRSELGGKDISEVYGDILGEGQSWTAMRNPGADGKNGVQDKAGIVLKNGEELRMKALEDNQNNMAIHFNDKIVDRMGEGDFWLLLSNMAHEIIDAKAKVAKVDPDLFIKMTHTMIAIMQNYTDAADDFVSEVADSDASSFKMHTAHERKTLSKGRKVEKYASQEFKPLFDDVGAMHRKNKGALKEEKDYFEHLMAGRVKDFENYADTVSDGIKGVLDTNKKAWKETKREVSKKKAQAIKFLGAKTKLNRALAAVTDRAAEKIDLERTNTKKMFEKVEEKSKKRQSKTNARTEKALERAAKEGEKQRSEEWKKVEDEFEMMAVDRESLTGSIMNDFNAKQKQLEKPLMNMAKEAESIEGLQESEDEVMNQHLANMRSEDESKPWGKVDAEFAKLKTTVEQTKAAESENVAQFTQDFVAESTADLQTKLKETEELRKTAIKKLGQEEEHLMLHANASLKTAGKDWNEETELLKQDIREGQQLLKGVGAEVGVDIQWPQPQHSEQFLIDRETHQQAQAAAVQAANSMPTLPGVGELSLLESQWDPATRDAERKEKRRGLYSHAHNAVKQHMDNPDMPTDDIPSNLEAIYQKFVGPAATSFLPKERAELEADKAGTLNQIVGLLDTELQTLTDDKWHEVQGSIYDTQQEAREAAKRIYDLQQSRLMGTSSISALAKAKMDGVEDSFETGAGGNSDMKRITEGNMDIGERIDAVSQTIRNILQEDGAVPRSRAQVREYADERSADLKVLAKQTWDKLDAVVYQTTQSLIDVEDQFIGDKNSPSYQKSIKGQTEAVNANIKETNQAIQTAAKAAFDKLNQDEYEDGSNHIVGVAKANRDELEHLGIAMSREEAKALDSYGQWELVADEGVRTSKAYEAESAQNAQKIEAQKAERIKELSRAGSNAQLAAEQQIPRAVDGTDKAAAHKIEEAQRAANAELGDDLEVAEKNSARENKRLWQLGQDTDEKLGRLESIRKSAQGKFSEVKLDASSLIDGIWGELQRDAEELSLEAAEQHTTEHAQQEALQKRADYLNNLIFRETGATQAAMTAEMQNAVTKSHDKMKQLSRDQTMTDARQWAAIKDEDHKLKQQLATIATRAGHAGDAVEAFVQAAYADTMDVASDSTAASSEVEGGGVSAHQAMQAAAGAELEAMAGGASNAEKLVQVLSHMKQALAELQDSMGSTFEKRQHAALEHIAHGHHASDQLASGVKDSVAGLLATQSDMVAHIKEGSERIAKEYFQRRDVSKKQLGAIDGMLTAEGTELAKDAGVLQARVEDGVNKTAGVLEAILPSVGDMLTTAENAEADRARTHGEFETGILQTENLESEHEMEEVMPVKDEVQKEHLKADRRQVWKHHFGMKQHAWKTIVANKMKELGYELDAEALQAMNSIHAHHMQAQDNAKFGADVAEKATQIERDAEAKILELHKQADEEINSILADESLSKAEKERKVQEIRDRVAREASGVFQDQTEAVLRQERLQKALNEYHRMVDAAKEATAEAIAAGHLSPDAVKIHKQLADLASDIAALHSQPWLQSSALQVGSHAAAATKVAATNVALTRSNAHLASEIHALEAALARRKAQLAAQ